jgi:thiol:disulfide interchange protein DsbA
MNYLLRLSHLFLLPFFIFASVACADKSDMKAASFEAGTHYQILANPARTLNPNKIEVMEVFWYGCSHCYSFQPMLHKWESSLADDVVFAKTPAIWRDFMKLHANVYYTAESLSLSNAGHDSIFALLAKSPRLSDQEKFADIFVQHGISRESFHQTLNSFGVMSKVSQSEKRVKKNYLVQGTPELIVNGKYRISGKMAGSQAGMLKVADYLIGLERQ